MTEISLFSMNVRGLGNKAKRNDVLHWLSVHKYDICCLQDIHISEKMKCDFTDEWDGECICSTYRSNSRGVAVLFKRDVDLHIHNKYVDADGNFIILDLTVKGQRFSLCTVYGPNQDCPEFYVNLFQELQKLDNASMILCGDWNLVMDYQKDTRGYQCENNKKARSTLLKCMNNNDLSDVWRVQHEHDCKFTWYKSVSSLQMARLDYFLVTSDIMNMVSKSEIIPGYRTDHSGTLLLLHIDNTSRGRGFWKFNS